MDAVKLIQKSLVVALLYGFISPGNSVAQEIPICTHQYHDADEDGFGWQNEASCLITSDSEPPPVFTNKSTGEPVTLVRPYWDGNTDIANRTIRCDRYDYQQTIGEYLRPVDEAVFNTLPDIILTHQSISTLRKYTPFVASDQDQEYYGWYALNREGVQLLDDASLQTFAMPLWRTNDGLYESPELLQAPYIEIVNPQGVKAIRIWFNEGDRFNTSYDFIDHTHNTEGYFQCYDEAGADFAPTGQIGTPGATPEPALQDLVISGQSTNDRYVSDGVVNLATGEPVKLSKVYWNYNHDLAGRLIQCDEQGFDPDCGEGYRRGCGFAEVEPSYYMMPWHLTDSTPNHGANIHWWRQFSGVRVNDSIGYTGSSIAPGRVPMFLRSDFVELIDDNKVRIWLEATDIGHSRFYECSVYPTGIADGETTNTETTINTADGSNNQTDGGNGSTQTGVNNQTETNGVTNSSMTLSGNTQANSETSSVTSGNSGSGSIDTWFVFLILSLSLIGVNISSNRKNIAKA